MTKVWKWTVSDQPSDGGEGRGVRLRMERVNGLSFVDHVFMFDTRKARKLGEALIECADVIEGGSETLD